ncbi:MAG: hypothetical protein LBC84_07710 [Prevotellaceae bacterium]|jgi:hypothetical protein|nr:hypothetical protein [Prevotellaceae bacterium]
MKISFYLLSIVLFCISCGGNTNAPAGSITQIDQDTTKIKTPEGIRMDSLLQIAWATGEPIEIIVDKPLVPQKTDKGNLTIIYNQSIEGYRIKVICSINELLTHDAVHAMMEFKNERTGAKFCILNAEFYTAKEPYNSICEKLRDNDSKYKGTTVYLDYDYSIEVNSDYLLSSRDILFGFLDVDFDGEKELLINRWWAGQRETNQYDIYKIKENTALQLTTPPFDRIDDFCTIDPKDKTIRVHYTGGASIWSDEYYRRLPSGKFELYRVEEYVFPFVYIKEKK